MALLAGRYRLLDVVGHGGMGTVWRAYDQHERRCVAVKLLHHRDAASLARLVREQALHVVGEHVAAPLDWIDDGERIGFSLELVRGGSLLDLQRDLHRTAQRRGQVLSTRWGVELVAQLLDGLVGVHAAGVVHRDVKPANLFLDATGSGRPHLRIGDFGVVTDGVGARVSPWPQPVGTPGYAAPEQLAGAPAHPAMDLYAVGVVAAELLPEPGRLAPLLESLRSLDPQGRPGSAAAARHRLLTLHPCDPTWTPGPDDPCVPDRLGPAAAPRWWARVRRPRTG